MIKIAIPSSHSRIHTKVMNILKIHEPQNPKKVVYWGMGAIVLIVRPWDIPRLLKENRIDFGFSGLDTFMELGCEELVFERFYSDTSRIAYCRNSCSNNGIPNELIVATEYPSIANRYFSDKKMNVQILKIRGSAEAFPSLDGISAIVDVVETGTSTHINHLKVCDSIMTTYPCLAASEKAKHNWPEIKFSNIRNIINNCLTQPGEIYSG